MASSESSLRPVLSGIEEGGLRELAAPEVGSADLVPPLEVARTEKMSVI